MECRSFPKREPRQKLLAALFAKAREIGVENEELREEIAPKLLKKRLSEASSQEIFRVMEHITGFYMGGSGYQKFESSKAGLLKELEDAAKARWGDDFKQSLLAFINSHGFKGTLTHYRFMKITELKAFKDRLKELNKTDRTNP